MRNGEVAEAAGGALHVTNGESTGNALQRSALEGTVLVWKDLFADGPLAPVEPADALRGLRVRFWAEAGRGVEAALAAELERRHEVFAEAMASGRHVVVWLEHDLLDQLQPAHILATIVAGGHDQGNVELVVVDQVEGHPNFRGLGELQPAELEALWPRRAALRPEAAALADGASTRHELLLEHTRRETVLFDGDAWFFERIAALGPLVESLAEERVAITDTGRRVLAGELDRVQVAGLDRWLGRTHLTPANAWRREDGRVVAPADREARAE